MKRSHPKEMEGENDKRNKGSRELVCWRSIETGSINLKELV